MDLLEKLQSEIDDLKERLQSQDRRPKSPKRSDALDSLALTTVDSSYNRLQNQVTSRYCLLFFFLRSFRQL